MIVKNPEEIRLVSWEEVKKRLDRKEPWYLSIYYFFRYRWMYKIQSLKSSIIGFFQRGRNGYARTDLWSFDVYLSGVIGKGLKELAKSKNGWPDSEFKTFEEWTATLNKMSQGFIDYHEKVFTEEGITDIDEGTKRLEESLELFKKYFLNLWD